MDLFEQNLKKDAPLADRMRPRTIEEFIGQEHIVGEGKLLRRAILADKLGSCIFYGPPGVGKSTLAEVIANTTNAAFRKMNAVSDGVKRAREIIEEAENYGRMYGGSTYLLLDECHRWSKTQSDSMLPAIEKRHHPAHRQHHGKSSCLHDAGHRLPVPAVRVPAPHKGARENGAVARAFGRGAGIRPAQNPPGGRRPAPHRAYRQRRLPRRAKRAGTGGAHHQPEREGRSRHQPCDSRGIHPKARPLRMDDGEYYDMLSAFCKSLRGSDSDAALFWCGRMLYAGVDPRIITRRMIVHASEDVGLANPQALQQAVAAAEALEHLGMPEARLNIAQAILFICEPEVRQRHQSRRTRILRRRAQLPAARAQPPAGYALFRRGADGQRHRLSLSPRLPRPLCPPAILAG